MLTNKIQMKAIIGLLLTAVAVLVAAAPNAAAQNQTETQAQAYERAVREQQEILAAFGKTSSTKIPIDEGNRIVAVRRYTFIRDLQGETRKENLVEIELNSKYQLPGSNANLDYVFFGDKVFLVTTTDGTTGRKIFVRMTPTEFEEIKDNALVTVQQLPGPLLERFRKTTAASYKNGEPKEVRGAKFGRLDKAMINKFPPLEEGYEASRKRIQ